MRRMHNGRVVFSISRADREYNSNGHLRAAGEAQGLADLSRQLEADASQQVSKRGAHRSMEPAVISRPGVGVEADD